MKKIILFIILISFGMLIKAQTLISTSEMNTINTNQTAFEGQIYKNSETNLFYIGLSGGTLIPIGNSSSSSNKKNVISAEYTGAVVVPGSGSDSHRGDMTGGNTGASTPYYMNYYEWKGRSTSGAQTYQVVVRITLPNDFTAWQSSNPFQFYNMANTNCNVTLTAYLSTSTTAFYSGSSISNSGWTLSSLTAANLSSWATAGQTASFVFTFSSTNGNVARIGDIILNYR